jgi:catechol 2,3-dioxygenase-like lactoylglutathione lyase family enzyme
MVGEDYSFSLIDDDRALTQHVHLAFPARDDATVRAFHAAALGAGYEDNGAPGERAVYHPGYYGAFVLDPDGHNVEVVNHNR